MTALQMNAEFFRAMGEIADDESLVAKVVKYVKKLAASRKQADPTLMTKEEFFQRVDEAKAQYNRGDCHEMLPNENLTDYLRRRGYAI